MALGQELRDFISAWQAGAKIMSAHDDAEYKKLRTRVEQAKLDKELDPERNKLETDAMRLKLDQSRASIARSNASTALSHKRGAILDERLRELKNGPKSAIPDVDPDLIGGAASRQGEYGTAPGKQSALDIGQPSLASYDDNEEEEDAAPAQFAAKGGAIRHYADGGLVEGEEDFDDEDAGWDEGALPVNAQPTQGRGTPGYSPMAANDAVRDGLNYGARSLGVSRRSGTGGLSKSAAQRYAEGYGAASPREVEAVKKAIDPEGRLSESQRAMAALGTVYSHYLARGDARAAQSAAFSLLQNYRVMSQRYAAIAAVAAQDGNIDEAAKAAIKAYENIPDTIQSNTFANATIRRLLQTTRLARLAGVSFHVINSQEPWTVSLPIIGGRHGFAATSRALIDAYNTIGARGGVVAGLRDTIHAARSDTGFTDYVQFFKDNIRSSKMLGGAKAQRLIEALEYGEKLNLYGNDTKFEVGKYADPTSNIAGRTLDRADLMANQVGSAVEGINRAVTTLAAYQLEYRKNGGNHEAAMEYAYRTAHNTMGDYSAWNAAPIFNTSAGRLALQFKKFSHKMYYLLGKVVGGAVRGDREAMKQFAGLMVTHAVVAGALGLPIEPFKLALVAANTLGLTGFGDDDFEDAVRRVLAEVLGSKGGEIAAHGLPRAFGIDTSSRQGLDSLLTFGAPKSQRVTDVKSWLFDTMAGAPVGYIMDQITSAQALAKGDVVTALEKTVPVRFATDIVKAVSGASGPKLDERGREKRQQLTPWQTAVRAAGFTPSVVSEGYKKSVNYAKAARGQSDQRAEFMAQWAAASPNERARLWGRIEIANRSLPKEARLTRAQLDKYARRRREERKTMVNGLRASRATRHIAEGLSHYITN